LLADHRSNTCKYLYAAKRATISCALLALMAQDAFSGWASMAYLVVNDAKAKFEDHIVVVHTLLECDLVEIY
jgi:hypothetical protein